MGRSFSFPDSGLSVQCHSMSPPNDSSSFLGLVPVLLSKKPMVCNNHCQSAAGHTCFLYFYTKQTQIALPLAMILFLAIRNRRWLRAYVSTLVVAGVVPFLCLQWITEGKYFLNTIVQAGLAYNPLQIPLILIHHAGPVFLCIGLAMVLLWKNQRFREWREMDFYLAAVTGITIISVGRIGAHGQYVVEWVVISLLYLIYKTEFPFFKRQKLLVAIQILVLLVYAPLFVFVEEGIGNISSYVAAQKIYPLLEMNHKPYSGPILSQQGSFALFSNEGIYIQLFHFVGLVRADLWDQQRILTPIKQRIFPWVITEFPLERNDLSADDRERFTPEILEALRENYQRRMVVNPYYLYVPKYSTPTP
ncbi:MAG: hypothetical protein P8Z37_10310 [Acidobacteriota bacterium]